MNFEEENLKHYFPVKQCLFTTSKIFFTVYIVIYFHKLFLEFGLLSDAYNVFILHDLPLNYPTILSFPLCSCKSPPSPILKAWTPFQCKVSCTLSILFSDPPFTLTTTKGIKWSTRRRFSTGSNHMTIQCWRYKQKDRHC